MPVKGCFSVPTFGQTANDSTVGSSGQSDFWESGPLNCTMQTLRTSGNWREGSRVGNLRTFIKKKIAENLQLMLPWEPVTLEFVTLFERKIFMEAASEAEYSNLAILEYKMRSLLDRTVAGNTSQHVSYQPSSLKPTDTVVPTSYSPHNDYSDASTRFGKPFSDAGKENGSNHRIDELGFFEGLFLNGYEPGLASNFDGNNLLQQPKCIKQVAEQMVYSPEETSTITKFSGGGSFSNSGSFETRPALSDGGLAYCTRTSFTVASSECNAGYSVNSVRPLKRLKVEYPCSPMSENSALSAFQHQPCEPERFCFQKLKSVEGEIMRNEVTEMDCTCVGDDADSIVKNTYQPGNSPGPYAECVLTSSMHTVSVEDEVASVVSADENTNNAKDDSEYLHPQNIVDTESVAGPDGLVVGSEEKNSKDDSKRLRFNNLPVHLEELGGCKEDELPSNSVSDLLKPAIENVFVAPKGDIENDFKMKSSSIRGISLLEHFTAEQLKEYLFCLSQMSDQICAKGKNRNKIASTVNENICQLCKAEKLLTLAVHCSSCGWQIKDGALCHVKEVDNMLQLCICTSCFKASRGENITVNGRAIPKSELAKKHGVVLEESLVQCNKCEDWHHQTCALYNHEMDMEMEGKAVYICPICCLKEMENGDRVPLPRSAILSAKDLPTTMVSNHIEQRLHSRLRQEREVQAKALGKNVDEVSGAEDLTVRVVLSVDKRLKAKSEFLDIFKDESYPAEFPYRSKVILLFQTIEGIDVCLFGIYVQEYGSKCGDPHQRCVYISYLDSAKHFRPERKAAGEALRTFVYHEILIGYLEYCKKRGFGSCYLWSCPPRTGQDYIFYSHPQNQKTPKSEKLRRWYHSMLKKASAEGIVVGHTNLYDHFFVPTGHIHSKVTASRLPYFDGDCWFTATRSLELKNREDHHQKKTKKPVTKRTLKAMGHSNPSDGAAKDVLLMQQLRQKVLPSKEDFIVVHLQFVCTHCHKVILSGWRWFCSQCKNFSLCERCCNAEKIPNEADMHTLNGKEKHLLSKVRVDDVSSDTEDNDAMLDIGLFKNRLSFVNLCQSNHYQFDTLRRAKYSSMMILHHLHSRTILNTGATCTICWGDTLLALCWECQTCPNFVVCPTCYQLKGASLHIHKLALHTPPFAEVAASKNVQGGVMPCSEAIKEAPAEGTQERTIVPATTNGVQQSRTTSVSKDVQQDTVPGKNIGQDAISSLAANNGVASMDVQQGCLPSPAAKNKTKMEDACQDKTLGSATICGATSKDVQHGRVYSLEAIDLRKLVPAIEHAHKCRGMKQHCPFVLCVRVKLLFNHMKMCSIRAQGGCKLCQMAWNGLQLHSRNCQESNCAVPRCRDLKQYLRQKSENPQMAK